MKILAFDTATAACAVALSIAGQIRERFEIAPQRHAELILPMVESLLAEAQLTPNQLDVVAYGCGPGSFMGARIATSVAQGIAFAADLPVIPVSTLQVVAQTSFQRYGWKDVLAAWDARLHAIYWGAYRLDETKIMIEAQSQALSKPEEIVVPSGENWYAVGNAWEVYSGQLTHIISACKTTCIDIYPQGSALVQIAEVAYQKGEMISPFQAKPVYLRDQVVV